MLIEHFTDPDDQRDRQPLARERRVPAQPEGVSPGKVYLGSDLGEVEVTGETPQAGDLVTVVGPGAKRVALGGQGVPAMRAPLFGGLCRCQCPASTGTIFYANPIQTGPYLVIMDGDGALKQTLNPPQLYRIAGIAVDEAAPNHLYVLDDRTRLNNFTRDASPPTQIAGVSTYALHTFVLSGGAYVWDSVVEMPDPGLPATPFFFGELQWVDGLNAPGDLTDPPAVYPTNCMSVIDGVLHLTMSLLPARYLTWDGTAFTTHSLLLDGVSFQKGLRGMVLSGIDKPGRKLFRYVLAWLGYGGFAEENDGGYEIIEFDPNDNITRRVANDTVMQSPTALMVICNRVYLLNSNYFGRTEDGGSGSLNGTFIQHGSGP